MGRPPSTDRKEVVTLRLRQSVLDAYKAAGEDWRSRMEAAIEHAMIVQVAPPPAIPPSIANAPIPPRAAPERAGRMTMDDVRPKFVPRLKPEKGKR